MQMRIAKTAAATLAGLALFAGLSGSAHAREHVLLARQVGVPTMTAQPQADPAAKSGISGGQRPVIFGNPPAPVPGSGAG